MLFPGADRTRQCRSLTCRQRARDELASLFCNAGALLQGSDDL
jgi:hypothetical protein